MGSWKWRLIAAAILCLLTALLVSSLANAQDVTVSIAAPTEVNAGTTFTVRINITSVSNFDVCNYDINYDPDLFEITNVGNGLIDDTTIPIGAWNEIAPGTISVVENVPGLSGISGSGYLAELQFNVIGEYSATSDISISNGILGDNTATEIPAIWTGATVNVLGLSTPTPTPITTSTQTAKPTSTPIPHNGEGTEIWIWVLIAGIFIVDLILMALLYIRVRR